MLAVYLTRWRGNKGRDENNALAIGECIILSRPLLPCLIVKENYDIN